jgi:glucose-6-phosphate isomerase
MSIAQTPTWKALQEHQKDIARLHLRELFAQDPQRFEKFHAEFDGIVLDFSKNLITEQTLELLLKLADEANIKEWTQRMFSGEKINITEDRAVLHVALRNRSNKPILVDGADVMPEVREQGKQVSQICVPWWVWPI